MKVLIEMGGQAYLPLNQYCFVMQPSISTQQVPLLACVEDLLAVVQTRMMEYVSQGSSRVAKNSASALDAARYHLKVGGQKVRARLALQAGLALGLTTADAVAIATSVELLHNASLIHDDIQDCEEVRRGQKAVWIIFGANTAICTGDLLLSAAYAALSRIKSSRALPAMISLVHERIAAAIDGQCADLTEQVEVAGNAASAIARYEQIAVAKSGALLCLPIELSLLAAGQTRYLPDATRAVEAFAISYQIVDDLNDVQSDTGIGSRRTTYNIVSIYNATGFAKESVTQAKRLGQHHLGVVIAAAARLPSGAGTLLISYAQSLRKPLAE